jgi:hypothetical protein
VDHHSGYHGIAPGTNAVRFLVVWMAGWVSQLEAIDFLREENRVLREQLGGRHLRFNDDQRRRLAVRGRIVGRRRLGELAGLVTPDTILRWYRELIARKYDGSARRRTGRPTVATDRTTRGPDGDVSCLRSSVLPPSDPPQSPGRSQARRAPAPHPPQSSGRPQARQARRSPTDPPPLGSCRDPA